MGQLLDRRRWWKRPVTEEEEGTAAARNPEYATFIRKSFERAARISDVGVRLVSVSGTPGGEAPISLDRQGRASIHLENKVTSICSRQHPSAPPSTWVASMVWSR